MSGMWIWPFELKEKIGEGGMGVVYKARYVKDDRLFAVKLIPADVENKTLIARFEREIDTLKKLRHPNIVRAFGGVCESKQRFYAMELVEGGTLWDKIQQQGFIPWDKVTDWGQQMCAALAYAHDKQIIHRDVKPNNFLISKTGQIKLSDFGLVSVMSEAKLTADGRTLGTVQYMSPEQIRGKPPLTHKTDLYSLGCVFYEMLTGNPPFTNENPGPMLHAHLTETPAPISAINPDCPPALERLIMKLLEKNPEDRPQDALEVAEKLSQIRLAPRLVESSSASHTKTRINSEIAPPELRPVYRAVNHLSTYVGIGLIVALLLVAASWTVTIFQSDPGTNLWVETLQTHPDTAVRVAAAEAVGKLARQDDQLLDLLMNISEDTNADLQVRRSCLEEISDFGKDANQFRSRISKLAKSDPSEPIRLASHAVLQKLGSVDAE